MSAVHPVEVPLTASSRPRSRHRTEFLGRLAVYAVLLILSTLMILPFLWMLSTALKPEYQVFTYPPRWMPQPVEWANFVRALTFLPFLTYFENTMTVVVLALAGDLFSGILAAYAFARLRAPGKNFLFVLLLSTMMLPYWVTIIPVFAEFNAVHLINTLTPLWLPHWLGGAFNIFLLRQFFLGIPKELEEAAVIDGAGTLTILTRIMLPLSVPAIITVSIFSVQGSWNDFLGPLIFLSSPSHYTLGLGLYYFVGQYQAHWNYLMAASLVVMLPLLVLFYFGQRLFVRGITLTGLKG